MRIQGGIGFPFYGGAQSIATDHDNGVQVMRLRTVLFALGGGQLNLRHGAIIGYEGQNERQSQKQQSQQGVDQ